MFIDPAGPCVPGLEEPRKILNFALPLPDSIKVVRQILDLIVLVRIQVRQLSPKNIPPVAARQIVIYSRCLTISPMEANYSISLSLFPAGIICLLIFVLGYWLGTLKTKKLRKQLARMEKKIMDLNTELLYGSK